IGYSKVKYIPCTNWGKKSRIICGERQYVLEEVTGWTNMGRFGELAGQETLDQALRRTQQCELISEDGTPLSWPSTMKEAEEGMEEHLVIESEEGVERVLGILSKGYWVQEEELGEVPREMQTRINLGEEVALGRDAGVEERDTRGTTVEDA